MLIFGVFMYQHMPLYYYVIKNIIIYKMILRASGHMLQTL
jgi:hypothetical protein